MLFGQDRTALRRFYVDAWRKYRERQPLEPLEAQVAEVVAQHPEYHRLLEDEGSLEREWLPEAGESNPFLHMAMHLGLREQVATNRPAGIAAIHKRLGKRLRDPHQAEHRMLECLAEMIWTTQRHGTPPDEGAYLACLRRL